LLQEIYRRLGEDPFGEPALKRSNCELQLRTANSATHSKPTQPSNQTNPNQTANHQTKPNQGRANVSSTYYSILQLYSRVKLKYDNNPLQSKMGTTKMSLAYKGALLGTAVHLLLVLSICEASSASSDDTLTAPNVHHVLSFDEYAR
jgi:hypothetical protein